MAYMNLVSNIMNTLKNITGRKYSWPENGMLCDSVVVINAKSIIDDMITGKVDFETGLIKIMARFDEAYNPDSYVAA